MICQATESADAVEVLDVSQSQVLRKELGVFATFGGAKFDNAFHFILQVIFGGANGTRTRGSLLDREMH